MANRTHHLRAVDVAVGGGLVILQGGTVSLIVHGSPRGVLAGIRHRIGVGGVGEEGGGLLRIHALEARRGAEVHGMTDV